MSPGGILKKFYIRLGFVNAQSGSLRYRVHACLCRLTGRTLERWSTEEIIEKRPDTLRVAVYSGIGDALWSLLLLKSLLVKTGMKKAILVVTNHGKPSDPRSNRSNQFLECFDFIDEVYSYPFPIHPPSGSIDSNTGYPDYLPGGFSVGAEVKYCDFKLYANTYLEHGLDIYQIAKIYNLDPDLVEFDIFKRYVPPMGADIFAKQVQAKLGDDYFVFYMSGLIGNTTAGFNRLGLWTVDEWIKLGKSLVEMGYKIVFVGAGYDQDYMTIVHKAWGESFYNDAINLVGISNMPETLEVIRGSRGVIGYPSGIPICSTYMQIRTAMFWRPQELSLSEYHNKFGFSREFSISWVPKQLISSKRYIPLWYGEDSHQTVLAKLKEAGWFTIQ